MEPTLFQYIEEGALVLTVNQRLSGKVLRDYHQNQKNLGKKAWRTPAIFPLSTWLEMAWKETAFPAQTLLSPFNEKLLWEKIIQATSTEYPLLPISGSAALTQEAYALLQDYKIPIAAFLSPYTNEVAHFLNWYRLFCEEKKKNNFVGSADLTQWALDALEKNLLNVPQKILFLGFDEYTPHTQNLIEALEKESQVLFYDAFQTKPPTHCYQWACTTPAQEIEMAALWAQQQLLHNKNASIGIIVPELSERRAEIISKFTEILSFENYNIFQPKKHFLFNVSAGAPLSHFPVIQIAESILEISPPQIAFEQLSNLIRSPFINHPTENVLALAELDLLLRNTGSFEFPLKNITALFQKTKVENDFAIRWESMLEWMNKKNTPQLPSTWAHLFKKQLSSLGWPHKNTITETILSILERFEMALIEWSAADAVLGKISRREAVNQFKRYCRSIIFQPKNNGASIQVLGVLEAAGWSFDALWLLGFHDQAWPTTASANPFIPSVLQKNYKLPHATAERELDYTQKITTRLLRSAPYIIASFPLEKEGQVLSPSPLITHFEKIKENILFPQPLRAPLKKEMQGRKTFWKETTTTPLQANEKIRGGSSLLESQAVCPFQAFAHYRLDAKELLAPDWHFTGALQGQWIHACLEKIWQVIETHSALLALSETEQAQLIKTTVLFVLHPHRGTFSNPLFLELEQERLCRLLQRWLDAEKKRPPFTVKLQEKSMEYRLADITLKIRIDRMDMLNDGSHVIIDYKTGLHQPISHWFNERLLAPQLPLYLHAYSEKYPIRGIAYAEVHPDRLSFKGVGASDTLLPGIVPIEAETAFNWLEAIAFWKTKLEKLAKEFAEGYAIVAPAHPNVCAQCDLHMLCRIHEKGRLEDKHEPH